MNSSHVRPISRHGDEPDDEPIDAAQPDDDQVEVELALARAASDLRNLQDRIVVRTERLVQRMSEPPPAVASGRR